MKRSPKEIARNRRLSRDGRILMAGLNEMFETQNLASGENQNIPYQTTIIDERGIHRVVELNLNGELPHFYNSAIDSIKPIKPGDIIRFVGPDQKYVIEDGM